MKVFLDTNTILDHILERNFHNEMEDIFNRCYERELEAYISSASIYTMTYYIQKSFSVAKSREIINDYLSMINVLDSKVLHIENGLKSSFRDFEEAYQYATALSEKDIAFFITVNTKDFTLFQWESLPVLNPKQFLERLEV
jgi:predicted nucleic acid-binding protein